MTVDRVAESTVFLDDTINFFTLLNGLEKIWDTLFFIEQQKSNKSENYTIKLQTNYIVNKNCTKKCP